MRYGAESPDQSQARSHVQTFLVHGHTKNSLLYHPLIDKLVEYWQVVAPSKGWVISTDLVSINFFLRSDPCTK